MHSDDPLSLLVELQQRASVVLIYSIRFYVVVWMLPPLSSDSAMPAMIRHSTALSLAVYASVGVSAAVAPPIAFDLALVLARESLIGVTIGFSASRVFWLASCVGAYIDNLSGYNSIQLINPSSTEESTPLSHLLSKVATGGFYAGGGLIYLTGAVLQTFQWWPPAQNFDNWLWSNPERVSTMYGQLMRSVASLVAPVLFALAMWEVVLAMMSRGGRGIDASAMAAPLRAATAVLAVIFFCTQFLGDLQVLLQLSGLTAELRMLEPATGGVRR